jgi:cytochrome c peroxidase
MKGPASRARVTLAAALACLGACDGDPAPTLDPDAVAYPFRLPAGFPSPRIPDGNPMSVEKVRLGRSLFYDPRLSGNQTQACASCHQQARAFSDGLATPFGSHGDAVRRNAMSLTNVAYNSAYTWANPNLRTLEQQVMIPLFGADPIELGLADREAEVLARLRADARYLALFRAAFPADQDPVSVGNIVRSLGSFERTLISADSAYDRSQRGDAAALSPSARRGRDLFFGERLECYHCHGGFNLTDSAVHAGSTFDELAYHNTGLYNLDAQGSYPATDRGLIEVTNQPEHMGSYRAPTLRNIALTAPYMHDGSVATLEDVIAHYASAGRTIASGPNAGVGSANPHKDGLVLGFQLTAQEQDDVLAFLRSLTDWGFVSDPRLANPFLAARSASCTDPGMPRCEGDAPSYRAEIAPMLQGRCLRCHQASAPAERWLLDDRAHVVALAASVAGQVRGCQMPPPESPPLADAERQRLLSWIACGAPDN